MNRLSVLLGEKIAKGEEKGRGGGKRCRQTFEAAIPPSCNYPADHLSVRSLSVNQFFTRVSKLPGKLKMSGVLLCFALSENREMEREPHCPFCKKSLISGKRINTVPVFGVSRNKTLLLDSGQDSVVLAQSFESLRFPLEQGESFSDLKCLTCARQAVRLASSVSNLTSRCNERTWNAKETDDIITSPEREASRTSQSTKRSAALRSLTGITPSG